MLLVGSLQSYALNQKFAVLHSVVEAYTPAEEITTIGPVISRLQLIWVNMTV